MTTFIIVLASAVLVYLVSLPIVNAIHEELKLEGRHD